MTKNRPIDQSAKLPEKLNEMKRLYDEAKKVSDVNKFLESDVGFLGTDGFFDYRFRQVYQANVGSAVREVRKDVDFQKWSEIEVLKEFLQNESLGSESVVDALNNAYNGDNLTKAFDKMEEGVEKFNKEVLSAINEKKWGSKDPNEHCGNIETEKSDPLSRRRGSQASVGDLNAAVTEAMGLFSGRSEGGDGAVRSESEPSLLGEHLRRGSVSSLGPRRDGSVSVASGPAQDSGDVKSVTSEEDAAESNVQNNNSDNDITDSQEEERKRKLNQKLDEMASGVAVNSGKYMTALAAFVVSPTLGMAMLFKAVVGDLNESDQKRGGDEAKISGAYEIVDKLLVDLQGDKFEKLKESAVKKANGNEFDKERKGMGIDNNLTSEDLKRNIDQARNEISSAQLDAAVSASKANSGLGNSGNSVAADPAKLPGKGPGGGVAL